MSHANQRDPAVLLTRESQKLRTLLLCPSATTAIPKPRQSLITQLQQSIARHHRRRQTLLSLSSTDSFEPNAASEISLLEQWIHFDKRALLCYEHMRLRVIHYLAWTKPSALPPSNLSPAEIRAKATYQGLLARFGYRNVQMEPPRMSADEMIICRVVGEGAKGEVISVEGALIPLIEGAEIRARRTEAESLAKAGKVVIL